MTQSNNESIIITGLPLFDFGTVVATQGARAACSVKHLSYCLNRHVQGDFGLICQDDKQANIEAISSGDRILSAYPINPLLPCLGHGGNCLWIITEADRSVTTFLLPDEY